MRATSQPNHTVKAVWGQPAKQTSPHHQIQLQVVAAATLGCTMQLWVVWTQPWIVPSRPQLWVVPAPANVVQLWVVPRNLCGLQRRIAAVQPRRVTTSRCGGTTQTCMQSNVAVVQPTVAWQKTCRGGKISIDNRLRIEYARRRSYSHTEGKHDPTHFFKKFQNTCCVIHRLVYIQLHRNAILQTRST